MPPRKPLKRQLIFGMNKTFFKKNPIVNYNKSQIVSSRAKKFFLGIKQNALILQFALFPK